MPREKMKCPACGGLMNNHAEKILYDTGAPDDGRHGHESGGVVHEIHGCPACGNVETKITA